jgi:hypothetical protein
MNAHLAHLRDNGCDVRLIDELQNRLFLDTFCSVFPLSQETRRVRRTGTVEQGVRLFEKLSARLDRDKRIEPIYGR